MFPPRRLAWALVLAGGALLRLQGLETHSLWFDEGHVLQGAKAPDFVGNLLNDRHPPLSFLAFRYWIRLFGEADWTLRLLPALLSCCALLLFARLARAWLPAGAALLATALLAVSPNSVWMAQEVRMYGFVELGACVGLLGAALFLDPLPRPRLGLALAAAGVALALGSHHMGALLAVSIGSLAIAARLAGRLDTRRAAQLFGAGALGVAVWLPWLLRITPRQLQSGWGFVSRHGLRDLVELPVRHLLIEVDAIPPRFRALGWLLGAALLGGFALHALALLRRTRPQPWPLVAFAAPVGFALCMMLFLPPTFGARYTVVAAPATVLMVAGGLWSLRPTALRAAPVAVALAGCLGLTLLHKQGNLREDFRTACAEVEARWRPGDWIVPVSGTFPGFNEATVVHYLHDEPELLAAVRNEDAVLAEPPPPGTTLHLVYREATYAVGHLERLLAFAPVVEQGPDRFRVRYLRCEVR